jgi:site-specific DNA recombinase
LPDYLPPPSTLLPGANVWAYLRDSGGPSQDRSVGQQKAEIEAYCQRHGLSLTLVFADVARSGGSTTGRDQFNEMIDMSVHKSTRPAALLIWNYARFARDLDDSQYYKSTLRKRDILVHSITDPIPEGPYGKVVEMIIDISNEEKKRQTGRDARRGLQDLVRLGCMPGTPPVGFVRQPVEAGFRRDGSRRTASRWVPDPEMIPRIQRAFAMRAAGESLAEINAQTRLYGGINSYRTFFSNKLYLGILEYGELVIENYCEPIIDQATWETVRKIAQRFTHHAHMTSEADHPRRIASAHLLSGLLYCARCGSPLWAHVTPKKKNDVECYRCAQRARRRDCDLPTIPAWSLERGVIAKLIEILHEPAYYLQTYHALQRQQKKRHEELDQRRKELQKDLVSLHRQTDNLLAAITERGHSRALLDRLDKLETQIAELKTALTEVKAALEHPLRNYTDAQLQNYTNRMIGLLSTGDKQTQHDIVQSLVAEIRIDRKGDQIIGEIVTYLDGQDDDNPPPPPGGSPPTLPRNSPRKGMRKSNTSLVAPRFTHTFEIRIQIYRKPRSK